MDNRREHYRLDLPAGAAAVARLRFPDQPEAVVSVVDLSTGGMAVRGEVPATPGRRGLCVLSLTDRAPTLDLPVELVHRQPGRSGLRFLPAADPAATRECERRIWGYLLDEQRRRTRAERAG